MLSPIPMNPQHAFSSYLCVLFCTHNLARVFFILCFVYLYYTSQRASIDVSDLSPDAAAGLLKELPRVVAAVKRASGAPAVKVLSNAGSAAGQVSPECVWCVRVRVCVRVRGAREEGDLLMCTLECRRHLFFFFFGGGGGSQEYVKRGTGVGAGEKC